MSTCTTVYPTSTRTTGAMWNPEMTANSTASSPTWRYCLFFIRCPTQHTHVHQPNVSAFMKQPSKECEPYRTSDGLPIAPCGAIANSLFNGESGCLWSPAPTQANVCRFIARDASFPSQTPWSCSTSIKTEPSKEWMWPKRASRGGRTSTSSSGTPAEAAI